MLFDLIKLFFIINDHSKERYFFNNILIMRSNDLNVMKLLTLMKKQSDYFK